MEQLLLPSLLCYSRYISKNLWIYYYFGGRGIDIKYVGCTLGEGCLFGGREADFSFIFHHSNMKDDLLVAFKKYFATPFEPGLIKVLVFGV